MNQREGQMLQAVLETGNEIREHISDISPVLLEIIRSEAKAEASRQVAAYKREIEGKIIKALNVIEAKIAALRDDVRKKHDYQKRRDNSDSGKKGWFARQEPRK